MTGTGPLEDILERLRRPRPVALEHGAIRLALLRSLWSLVDRLHRSQEGFLLQWAIVVSLVGVFVVLPVAVLATSSFRGQSRVEDNTRAFYTIEGAVYGIVADLINGADAIPLPPDSYTPPPILISAKWPLR